MEKEYIVYRTSIYTDDLQEKVATFYNLDYAKEFMQYKAATSGENFVYVESPDD